MIFQAESESESDSHAFISVNNPVSIQNIAYVWIIAFPLSKYMMWRQNSRIGMQASDIDFQEIAVLLYTLTIFYDKIWTMLATKLMDINSGSFSGQLKNFSVGEMTKFLVLLINMGLSERKGIKDHWIKIVLRNLNFTLTHGWHSII